MKTAFTLIAVFSCVLSSSALAEGWKTLAGYKDVVTLKEGETAFIVSVSQDLTLQYDKAQSWPPRPVQVRLGTDRCQYGYVTVSTRKVVTPSTKAPFPISGPCKLSLKTSGMVTMKVVGDK